MLLKIEHEKIEEVKSIIMSVFSDMSGKKSNIYLYHMLHINNLSKKMCEEKSGVTSTAYYRFRVNSREELVEIQKIVSQILKFKESYKKNK